MNGLSSLAKSIRKYVDLLLKYRTFIWEVTPNYLCLEFNIVVFYNIMITVDNFTKNWVLFAYIYIIQCCMDPRLSLQVVRRPFSKSSAKEERDPR